MADNAKIAADLLEVVGGKENVSSVTHCMTRLRLKLKDASTVSQDAINSIDGVIKLVIAGKQYQVVIGQNVDQVYREFCALGGFEETATVEETAGDEPKEKITARSILSSVMEAVSGSLTPVLPAIIAAGIFKMVAVLLGPKSLGLLAEESQLYIFCNLVNDAIYYFLPFFVAWSAAKKFAANPLFAMMIVAVMVHPTMLGLVEAGDPFSIFGFIPMHLVNYTQAVIPIVLITWVLAKVEKWVRSIMPDMLRVIGVPVLSMLIMLPLALCLLGPICYVVMGWVASGILWLNDHVGILAIIVVAAAWSLIISFGMHMPIMMTLLPVWLEMGYDSIVSPGTIASALAGIGVELAYSLRASRKDDRALGWSCLVTNVSANISEPALYGILLRDKKALAWDMLGAASGGAVMYVLGAKVTLFSGVGFPFLNFLRFGEYAVAGTIGMVTAFAVALALGIVFGFDKAADDA